MKRFPALLLSAALLLSPAFAVEGEEAYLTCGKLTATAEDYAQAVVEVGNSLFTASKDREVPFFMDSWTTGMVVILGDPHYSFAWDNTIDGITFDHYLAQTAKTLAFYRAWSESELAPQPTEAEFQSWKRDREVDGRYLRFYYIPVRDAQTADALQAALNKDEGRLEELQREYSEYPSAPLEEAGPAELFVPGIHALLRDSHGQWAVDEHDATYERVYGVAKALPLTMDNYRELLLQEAWPGTVDPGDIRLADGAEELDAVKLYEDWFDRSSEEGAVDLSFPEWARIPEEAVIAPAGAAVKVRSAAGTEDKFPVVKEYPGYTDVQETDWFYDNAKLCYEIGIMTGTDIGFEPGKTLTGAECAALAARLREGLTGKAIPAPVPDPGRPWYQHYVDYLWEAVQESGSSYYGIIDWEDLESPATRYDFLVFMALVADGNGDYFSNINNLSYEDLPDNKNDNVALQFYNWGILTGVDKYGTLAPDRTLTRAEAAAMVARMAKPELRKTFVPADYSPFTAAYLTPDTVMFDTGLTAEEFLITVNNAIAAWEEALEDEFNWHYVWSDGKTVLDHVKEDSLSALGVTGKQGTGAYQDFDVQVYYARLIDLTGETL